jgi:hypothetical protein
LSAATITSSMKRETINQTILKYLKHVNNSEWIIDEAYKFEFASYLHHNIDFDKQENEEILSILLKSQTLKYDRARGIQFIQKSGRETLSTFIQLQDVEFFRLFRSKNFEDIVWNNRTMSYTALSAWLSTLFPNKFFPVPTKGLNQTINYLFDTDLKSFPKAGYGYVLACQYFMNQTVVELQNYPVEEIHLKVWNKFFNSHPELNIKTKTSFDKIDWNWLSQDFHLFIYRKVLKLYKSKTNFTVSHSDGDFEPTAIEGNCKLAIHMRYERNSSLIKKIKNNALKSNPMLNCEACGFSFFERYGKLGQGFIEAHHNRPLSDTKETKTTRKDINLVCSNCHKMIHKAMSQLDDNFVITIEEFKSFLIE